MNKIISVLKLLKRQEEQETKGKIVHYKKEQHISKRRYRNDNINIEYF